MDSDIIDKVNICRPSFAAVKRLRQTSSLKPDYLLIDAMRLDVEIPEVYSLLKEMPILCLSANVLLLRLLGIGCAWIMDYDECQPPGYDFARKCWHMEQRKSHLEGQYLDTMGVSPIHRKTFEPVKSSASD